MRHVYPIRHAFSRHLYGYLPERALIKSAENSWYLLGFHVNQLRELALLVRKRWPTRDSSFCFFFSLLFNEGTRKKKRFLKSFWEVNWFVEFSCHSFFSFFFLRWTIFVMEEDDQRCFKIWNFKFDISNIPFRISFIPAISAILHIFLHFTRYRETYRNASEYSYIITYFNIKGNDLKTL